MKGLKKVTCELIYKLDSGDYDSLKNLMDERQQLLDTLGNMDCTKGEYKKAAEEFEIIKLQDKLFKVMNEKRNEFRKKIDMISKKKVMAKSYNNYNIGGNIFSKKI